jgi:hypothetical protein
MRAGLGDWTCGAATGCDRAQAAHTQARPTASWGTRARISGAIFTLAHQQVAHALPQPCFAMTQSFVRPQSGQTEGS